MLRRSAPFGARGPNSLAGSRPLLEPFTARPSRRRLVGAACVAGSLTQACAQQGRAPSPGFVDRPAAGATERTLRTAAEKLEKSVCVLKSAGSYALAVFGHVRSKFSQSNQVVSDLSFVDRGKPTAGMIPDDLTEEGGWYWAHPQGREGHRGDVRTPQETAGTARHAGGRDVVESVFLWALQDPERGVAAFKSRDFPA